MKTFYDSAEAVPEALRDEYEERDGKFVLKLEGDGYVASSKFAEVNAKLAQFRSNNTSLLKERADLTEKLKALEGIDPEKYQEALSKLSEFEKKGVSGVEGMMDVVRKQVEAAVGPLQAKLNDITSREAAARQALSEKELENALREAGTKAGIDDRALDDFITRGKKVFRMEEGQVIAKRGEEPIFSAKNPSEPLGPIEWALGLQTDAPHLFKPSKGGGASGGGSGTSDRSKRYISTDPLEVGRNLEDIAAGRAVVIAGGQ